VTTRKKMALGAALWCVSFVLGIFLMSVAASYQEAKSRDQVPAKGEAKAPQPIEIQGIENTFRLSPRLYSGGDPHGAEALAALKKLGVRTIISVDGATPDVETARK